CFLYLAAAPPAFSGFFFTTIRPAHRSTLFPYTTLFRSQDHRCGARCVVAGGHRCRRLAAVGPGLRPADRGPRRQDVPAGSAERTDQRAPDLPERGAGPAADRRPAG